MAEENITLIDAQTDVEGKLRGKDALVRGRFKGEIEVSGKLVLGEGSRVEATVVADAAEISGELKGDVKARSLVLAEKARVQGTVDAQVPLHAGEYLRDHLPNNRATFFPGEGHMLIFKRWAEILQQLVSE